MAYQCSCPWTCLGMQAAQTKADSMAKSAAWPTDNEADVDKQIELKRIASVRASSNDSWVIHSPRAKPCTYTLSDRCNSPDVSKYFENILSPRSAFSITSRSTGSTSAFSTPSTTPRSARGTSLTPRRTYAMVARQEPSSRRRRRRQHKRKM